jgi:hypothetical protein
MWYGIFGVFTFVYSLFMIVLVMASLACTLRFVFSSEVDEESTVVDILILITTFIC